MRREAKNIQVTFDKCQEAIDYLRAEVIKIPPPINLPELQIRLSSVIMEQLNLGRQLFESYKKMPKFLYYHIGWGYCVKILTGMKGASHNYLCPNNYFYEFVNVKQCPECLFKNLLHLVVEVPFGFSSKKSHWSVGSPLYYCQCTGCNRFTYAHVLK